MVRIDVCDVVEVREEVVEDEDVLGRGLEELFDWGVV